MNRQKIKSLVREMNDAIKIHSAYSHRTPYVPLDVEVAKDVKAALKQMDELMAEREGIE